VRSLCLIDSSAETAATGQRSNRGSFTPGAELRGPRWFEAGRADSGEGHVDALKLVIAIFIRHSSSGGGDMGIDFWPYTSVSRRIIL